MPIFLSEDFNGATGATLQAYNPAWAKTADGPDDSRITSGKRLRYSGTGPFGGRSVYLNSAVATSPDGYVEADVMVAGEPSISNRSNSAAIYFRCDGLFKSYYRLGFRAGLTKQIQLSVSSNGSFFNLGTQSWTYSIGVTQKFKLEVVGTTVVVYLNNSPILSITDNRVQDAGGVAVECEMGEAGTSDSRGVQLDNIIGFEAETGPMPLDPNAVYSEFRTVTPTMTTTGFLNPNAVYSEFRIVTPTLVPVVYPLDVTPVFSRFYAVQPVLIGAETTLDVPPVYSEWHAVQPLLATGSVIEPQPVYSEWYAVEPEMIPGPVEMDLTPVYSRLYTVIPSLAMALTLNPNAVYSEWYARKPTLKSRFSCGTIASLQDRLKGTVAQDGGSSCSLGVLGSSEVVTRW